MVKYVQEELLMKIVMTVFWKCVALTNCVIINNYCVVFINIVFFLVEVFNIHFLMKLIYKSMSRVMLVH